eukprot:scaffold3155_cov358-Prasinococcus_capsulatus_cf.AAC.2
MPSITSRIASPPPTAAAASASSEHPPVVFLRPSIPSPPCSPRRTPGGPRRRGWRSSAAGARDRTAHGAGTRVRVGGSGPKGDLSICAGARQASAAAQLRAHFSARPGRAARQCTRLLARGTSACVAGRGTPDPARGRLRPPSRKAGGLRRVANALWQPALLNSRLAERASTGAAGASGPPA